MGLVGGVVFEPLPRDSTLNSCSFVADCERSTCRKADLPSSMVTPLGQQTQAGMLSQGFDNH